MKSNRCVISKSDYDCYTMHLPVSMLIKKRREKYVSSQLEKMHPCFPKDQCYKSKIKLLREGFVSEVVVINRYKLDEYKKLYPGKKMWIDEVQETFEDYGKVKIISGVLMVCLVICLLMGISYISIKKQKKISTEEKKFEVHLEVPEQKHNLLNDIFKIVGSNNGVLTNFKWELSGFYETLDLSLENIFPECFDSINDSVIVNKFSYNKGLPVLKIYTQNKISKKMESGAPLPSGIKNKIRVITNSEISTLLDENIKNNSFTFRMEDISFVSEVFEQLEKIVNEYNCGIYKIAFQIMDNGSILVDLGICGFETEISLDAITQNNKLIKKIKNQITEPAGKITAKKNEKHKEVSDDKKLKMGEIIKKDGTRILFYKNTNGKIIKEIK